MTQPNLAFAVILTLTASISIAADAPIDFNRQVRTILSDKCYLCHGPDEATRQASLRLDDRDAAIDGGAIVPGSADDSELVARILSDDPDRVMPPPETSKPITAAERDILRAWIDQDAPYAQHWAFVPPTRPMVPTVVDDAWPRGDLDRFVLARLESHDQHPAPPADPATLVRRTTFDLIGLPPTPDNLDRATRTAAELDAYLTDLIDSPHFGERWARWWLDAARYADSAGYEKDMPRQVWFYRDYVIDAMNQDLPYNQFIIEQIAGDLLPNATQSTRVATGFLRNSMTNEEGGADPEQFRVEGMFDRIDAIGKAILGITTQCAQCHTHKYDPLSHREYYQMFAALNDIEEASISVFTTEQLSRRDAILHDVQQTYEDLKSQTPHWRDRIAAWSHELARWQPDWTTMTPTERPFQGQKFRGLPDGSILSESYAPTKTTDEFSLIADIGTITAVRLDALTHPQLPRGGPGRSIDGTGAISEFEVIVEPINQPTKALPARLAPLRGEGLGVRGSSSPISLKFSRAFSDANAPTRKLPPQYREKNPATDDRTTGDVEFAFDGNKKTAWTTDVGPGRSNQSRHAIFVCDQPLVVNGPAKLTFRLTQNHGGWNSDDNQNFLLGRYRFRISGATTIPEQAVPTAMESIIKKSSDHWTDAEADAVFAAWCETQPHMADRLAKIERRWQDYPATASQLVVQSRDQPRPTYVYTRGDFLRPAEPVTTDAPAFLNPMSPPGPTPDRLRFAQWLVADDAPTTARVIVNRIWQAYFGRGLVSSPEDFGLQSLPPSHPDLLDYLAVELMENDWSLKHIHRLIIDSATYRQSSHADASSWLDDPQNESLARGPRKRLEAEMVRDLALAASGLLDTRIGGPSVYPPAPSFLFLPPTSYGPKVWKAGETDGHYRRSLYVHQYRSVPYPPLQMFDAPKGDAACVRRNASNTPLQALVLLNESQFVDAARGLAAKLLRDVPAPRISPENDQARLLALFQICTSRVPNNAELEILQTLLEQQRIRIASEPDRFGSDKNLRDLIGVDPLRCRQLTGHDATELAAWLMLARTVLNLDETITSS